MPLSATTYYFDSKERAARADAAAGRARGDRADRAAGARPGAALAVGVPSGPRAVAAMIAARRARRAATATSRCSSWAWRPPAPRLLRGELQRWQEAHIRLAEMGCRAVGSDEPELDARARGGGAHRADARAAGRRTRTTSRTRSCARRSSGCSRASPPAIAQPRCSLAGRGARASRASPTGRPGPPDGPGRPDAARLPRVVVHVARARSRPLAEAGWHGVAPDLPGFGDSPPDPPGTWEHHVEHVRAPARRAWAWTTVVLVVHDWGGLIGLRWACEHPAAVRALVISATGFFPDGKWHGMAHGLREEGTGEQLVDDMTRANFGALMAWASRGMDDETIDEFWKCFGDDERRAGAAGAVPLGRLREDRAPRGQAGRAGRAHAAPLGRGRPVRAAGRRAPLRRARSRAPSWWCSTTPATSSGRTSPSAARAS